MANFFFQVLLLELSEERTSPLHIHRPERNDNDSGGDAAGMGRKKKKYEEELPWCFYCDREFNDEKILIQHQRAKVREYLLYTTHTRARGRAFS